MLSHWRAIPMPLVPVLGAHFMSHFRHNSIRLFLLDEATGQLSPGPFVPSGQWPRGMNVVDKTATSPALLIVCGHGHVCRMLSHWRS